MRKSILILVVTTLAMAGCVFVYDGGGDGMSVRTASSYSTDMDRSDGDLARSIRDAYLAEPALQGLDLRISARKGVVTLRGNVRDSMQAERAIDIASKTSGVTRVESRLAVGS